MVRGPTSSHWNSKPVAITLGRWPLLQRPCALVFDCVFVIFPGLIIFGMYTTRVILAKLPIWVIPVIPVIPVIWVRQPFVSVSETRFLLLLFLLMARSAKLVLAPALFGSFNGSSRVLLVGCGLRRTTKTRVFTIHYSNLAACRKRENCENYAFTRALFSSSSCYSPLYRNWMQ